MLNVICAISMVIYPIGNIINVNNIIRDTPVTISGLRTGMLEKDINKDLLTGFMLLMPRAATVPTMVAVIVDMTAIVTVLERADIIALLSKRSLYHRREKPVKLESEDPSLNEKSIIIAIGVYKIINMIDI